MQIFIISWTGYHEKAIGIANQIEKTHSDIHIVYSDVDHELKLDTHHHQIHRPNQLFFGDKFKACLDHWDQSSYFLLIHADTSCSDWNHLIKCCESTFENYLDVGVWAPLISYTGFDLLSTEIGKINNYTYMVAHTDSIVFSLKPSIVRRLMNVNYEKNIYGWGIGWMAVVNAYANKMFAVVDGRVRVSHPKPRSYSSSDATQQREAFLKQLTPHEKIMRELLQSHMRYKAMNLLRSKENN